MVACVSVLFRLGTWGAGSLSFWSTQNEDTGLKATDKIVYDLSAALSENAITKRDHHRLAMRRLPAFVRTRPPDLIDV
jgi:hypothetical protein